MNRVFHIGVWKLSRSGPVTKREKSPLLSVKALFMATLSENWITEKWLDFEYKKYVLLAYLQEVEKNFTDNKLYPSLAELIEHYRRIRDLKALKEKMSKTFPVDLKGFAPGNAGLVFESCIQDSEMMSVLEEIMTYAMEHFEHYLDEGRQIYEWVERHVHIFPIGLVPLKPHEGYLILDNRNERKRKVYTYRISVLEAVEGNMQYIETSHLVDYETGINHTFEAIKVDLLRKRTEWPNPAAYGIETDLSVPFPETLLPIAKRMLVRSVAQA